MFQIKIFMLFAGSYFSRHFPLECTVSHVNNLYSTSLQAMVSCRQVTSNDRGQCWAISMSHSALSGVIDWQLNYCYNKKIRKLPNICTDMATHHDKIAWIIANMCIDTLHSRLWIPWSRHPSALADDPNFPQNRAPLWTYNDAYEHTETLLDMIWWTDFRAVDDKYGLIWTMTVKFWNFYK